MRLPIVYHPDYNFDLDQILGERLLMAPCQLPYETQHYHQIWTQLKLKYDQIYRPEATGDQDLMLVHTSEYLTRLKDPAYLATCFDIPSMLVTPQLSEAILYSARLMTGGSLHAVALAFTSGWAINLGGGFHHAKESSGGGECIFSDIALIVRQHTDKRILIIDLDAHRGNGYAQILHLQEDQRVFIFDVFNARKYPYILENDLAYTRIDFPYPIFGGREASRDAQYLQLLQDSLPQALTASRPDLCLYIAGSDVYCNDPFGGLGVSAQGIVKRDQYVFELAREHGVPIVMLLGGGYAEDNASVVAHSIKNLIKKLRQRPCQLA